MNLFLKVLFTALCLSFICNKSLATHIVGGEFEMIHRNGFNYTFNLIIYFDDVNGTQLILSTELAASATILRKSDNTRIRNINLFRTDVSYVSYTNIDCTIESLRTRRLFYTVDVFLDPEIFNEPEGYYISWERCCRNNFITNIQLPFDNTVGQTFYLEFPPVVDENGDPFVNSSPILFPPLSDYACVGQFYYVDFAGSDADGDSIVYSMEDPLDSTTDMATVQYSAPGPYPIVPWIPGVGTDNQIPGNPSLNVSDKGFLTVTPAYAGLFVFSVKAEEFRDGKKIGEVRRDFQMLVIDCPNPGSPPDIFARLKGQETKLTDGAIITLDPDDPRCLDLFITDEDTPENLTVRAIPVNFKTDISDILSLNHGVVLNESDTLQAEVCFPYCPYSQNVPMYVDLVAYDDACSLPLSDTLRIGLVIISPHNNKPAFVDPVPESMNVEVMEGNVVTIPIKGVDIDNDLLQLLTITDGFNLEEVGMQINTIENKAGEIEAELIWDTRCDVYDFSMRSEFNLSMLLEDIDFCMIEQPDFLNLTLSVILPENNDPEVSTSLAVNTIFADIGETIEFNVKVTDIDNNYVLLNMVPDGFTASALGVEFEPMEGLPDLNSPFSWHLDCHLINLEQKDQFTFYFIAVDVDKCNFPNADSVKVNVVIRPPENRKPDIDLGELPIERFNVIVGNQINFTVRGLDLDGDSVYIDMLDREKYVGYDFTFEAAKGIGSVTSEFSWVPNCLNLGQQLAFSPGNQQDEPAYTTIQFIVWDNFCINPQSDTLTVEVALEDLLAKDEDFIPPNVFTPNDDGVNDVFTIPNLPQDNCYNEFISIEIYNRLGKKVFEKNERTFAWEGDDVTVGPYYYLLKFTRYEYNGIVYVLR